MGSSNSNDTRTGGRNQPISNSGVTAQHSSTPLVWRTPDLDVEELEVALQLLQPCVQVLRRAAAAAAVRLLLLRGRLGLRVGWVGGGSVGRDSL